MRGSRHACSLAHRAPARIPVLSGQQPRPASPVHIAHATQRDPTPSRIETPPPLKKGDRGGFAFAFALAFALASACVLALPHGKIKRKSPVAPFSKGGKIECRFAPCPSLAHRAPARIPVLPGQQPRPASPVHIAHATRRNATQHQAAPKHLPLWKRGIEGDLPLLLPLPLLSLLPAPWPSRAQQDQTQIPHGPFSKGDKLKRRSPRRLSHAAHDPTQPARRATSPAPRPRSASPRLHRRRRSGGRPGA